jgi:hypothetical protein
VGQDVVAVEPSEAIFELQEVPGPVFALKQQGDTVLVPAQTPERHDQRHRPR